MEDTTSRIFEIPASNLDLLQKKLEKLGRRAVKIGLEKPSYRVLSETDKEIERQVGVDYEGRPAVRKLRVHYAEVEITGPVVKVADWSFVATVEHTTAGNAIKKVPGYTGEIPLKYREGDAWCDHCETKRRRKDSYLCTNGKEWKQVGSNCLADFIGRDPAALVWGLTFWDAISACSEPGDRFGESSGRWSFDFEQFMTAVCHFVRKSGWLSKAVAREQERDGDATASQAWWLVSPSFTSGEAEDKKAEWTEVSEEDREKAAKALEWTLALLEMKSVEERNDYEQNLHIALAKPGVECKDAGIVASLIVGYMRHLEQELYKKGEGKKSNEWLWKVKDRVRDVELTLISQKSFESDWGASVMHIFEDNDGNKLQWWGSVYACDKVSGTEADIGDKVIATWTVKKHDEYKGRKQTVLTRPAKMQVLKAAAAEGKEENLLNCS